MYASLGRGALSARCTAGPNTLGYFGVFSFGATVQKPFLLKPSFAGYEVFSRDVASGFSVFVIRQDQHSNRNVYQTYSPELEVGNGKNYQCPKKPFAFSVGHSNGRLGIVQQTYRDPCR